MRKLLKVQLKNFQKHEDLTVEFNDNFNVITGETGAGKTVIYRSIEWLCNYSDVSEEDYRKEGTKETSVKGWFDNGVQLERIRTNSINRYVISKEGTEDQVFDSFGKDAPDEVKQIIGFDAIDIDKEHIILNFAGQDQLNFILDSNYSDGFKAQLFNKLTGNEVLDATFKDLNKENLRISREIKENEEKVQKQQDELVELSEKYKIQKDKLSSVKEQYEKVKEDVEIYNHLKDLCEKLSNNDRLQQETNEKINKIKTVSDSKFKSLKKKVENYEHLNDIANDLQCNQDLIGVVLDKIKTIGNVSEKKIKELRNKAEQLEKIQALKNKLSDVTTKLKEISSKKIKTVDVNFEELKLTSQKMVNVEKLKNKFNDIAKNQTKVDQEMNQLKETIASNEKELKELWAESPNCPLCGQEICKHG
jgi:DNA repair protein RecN (Recombination protein N)